MCDYSKDEIDKLLKEAYPDMEFEELSPEVLKKCEENLEAFLKDKEKRKKESEWTLQDWIIYNNARF